MNGRYKDVNRESSRFVFQDISNLWNATAPSPVDITGKFTSREFTFALQHLKPGEVYSPKSICPELLLYTGAALKSWLCGFLSSCLRRLKIRNIWRRALVVAIPKPKNPVENCESYRPIFFVSPTRFSIGLSTPTWNRLSIHSSLGSRLDFDTEG